MKKKVILSAATLFGAGFVPLCPGTVASALGLFLVWFIPNQAVFSFFAIIVIGLAFAFSGKAEKIMGKKDPKPIVIDEFAGILVTFLFVPREPLFILAGFFLFRLLDIIKIPPADKLEKKNGSFAIVGDDLAAGIYANFTLQFLRLLLKISS